MNSFYASTFGGHLPPFFRGHFNRFFHYISPQLDKQLDDRQRTALLSPEGLDCSKEKEHPILGKNGKALNCILRIDPRSNGVVYDFSQQRRQEQQEKQEQKAEKAQEQAPDQGQGRGRKR